jgi:GNAT superfamily N-acetyltransferase
MIEIRNAISGDEKAIFGLIKELAFYEKAPEQVTNSAEQLRIDLFQDKICEAIVATKNDLIIGFALYYTSYSTWKGRCLYLEDFYVQEKHRKCGAGGFLFDKVVEIAKEQGVKRMDWQVLEWNQLALDFYKKRNASLDSEWVNGRLFFE